MQEDLIKIEEKARDEAEKRQKEKHMKVVGKSVFQIKKIIAHRAKDINEKTS